MIALILAGIGMFGIAGFIALAIFAPPIAASLAKAALNIVSALWQTRIGMAAMVGTACFLGGLSIGDWKGAARIQSEWDDAKIAYAKQMDELREGARATAIEQARKAQEAENTLRTETDERIADYERKLNAAAPAGACTLDDADLAAGRVPAQSGGRRDGKAGRRNSR